MLSNQRSKRDDARDGTIRHDVYNIRNRIVIMAQLRKTCTLKSGGGSLFGFKSTIRAPVNWMIATCGSVNFSLARFPGEAEVGKEDIVLSLNPDKGTIVTAFPGKRSIPVIGKKLLDLPVEYKSRGSAIADIICRARAVNDAEKHGVDSFDPAYEKCKGK